MFVDAEKLTGHTQPSALIENLSIRILLSQDQSFQLKKRPREEGLLATLKKFLS